MYGQHFSLTQEFPFKISEHWIDMYTAEKYPILSYLCMQILHYLKLQCSVYLEATNGL